ncbi:MerR family transcriptional regulator [Pseudoduganella armeniaca]|uniref:MerR family transcriptional regulator n=1 Tax=Pseudoduganella armeniaca TaxID=2072590 RepID=A0A2R4CEY9_9BURK|nr:MerR family transcriptional regulator [Pseudoduganella armeniaca]AVR98207.1 MerR family transcriptional regulator [Pseudoduganella armeniaca]
MLKIGELASRAGLTVRTLHHYDDIGLLSPSARSDAGYRLYSRDDVARLHQIQALRQFGMPLADIGTLLAGAGISSATIIDRQLAALDRQISEAARMREQLLLMRGQLATGESPDLASWLTTLEQMNMYEKYFSKDELAKLALYHDDGVKAEWKQLVEDVDALIKSAATPDQPDAKTLALRWMTMLDRDTGGDPSVMARLNIMHEQEQAVQQSTGITPAIRDFMVRAMGEIKLDTWAKYLTSEEMARMRRHYATRANEWPPLIEAISRQMQATPTPDNVDAKLLAGQWMELFHDMVGNNPDTLPRFRRAIETEPLLRVGRGMTDEMLAWLRAALHRS